MFLSPLNWHFAKSSYFELKQADTDVPASAGGSAPDPRAAPATASAPAAKARVPLVVEEL
jgi:hypothetical protein